MHRDTILGITDWLLPPNVFRLLTQFSISDIAFYWTHRDVVARNRDLRGRHAGARCFILCNGPSVKRQDIRPLHDEIVFSVSNGFHHPNFAFIRPRYHCVPQLTFGNMTRENAINWFGEMHANLHDAEIFLATQEYPLVRSHGLFADRQVRYLCFGKRYFARRPRRIPDLTAPVQRVSTVPIMAIMIALYMGFKQIYLLGTDHDWFVTKRYDYFFDRSKVGWNDLGVQRNGTTTTSLLEDLPYVRHVWEQYRSMGMIAELAGAKIHNATDGGLLDVFERVRYEDVIAKAV